MGNSESTPSPVNRSHRLSKPPINFSSSSLLATASQHSVNIQSSPVSSSLYSLDIEANTSLENPQRTRQDARQKLRAQLIGVEADSPVRGSSEDDNVYRNSLGNFVKGVKRLSRSGSQVSQNASARGSATQLANSLPSSRLSLVPEGATHEPNESDQTFQEIIDKAEMAAWDEHAANANRQYSVASDDDSSDAAISPYRRRSLFMPGIATRGGDILRRPPPPEHSQTEPDRNYYFNPSHSEISPLDKLAALDLAEEGRRSPTGRAETPCDLDFTQLGALKLGTLRITNGAASPVPPELTPLVRSGRSTPEIRRDEDYYTTSEGHSSEENSPPDSQKSSSFVETGSYERLYVPSRAEWKNAEKALGRPARSGSPLKFQREAYPSDDEPAISRMSSERKSRPSSFIECPTLSPDGASSIAQEYIFELSQPSVDELESLVQDSPSELPSSRYSFDRTHSPERAEMQVTSKATEYDDMLFDDEGVVASPIEQTGVSNFDHPLMSSTSTRDFGAALISGTSQQTVGNIKSASSSGKPAEESLRKTDSGYSSTASLRSVQNVQSSRSMEPLSADPSPWASEKKPSLPDIREASPLPEQTVLHPRPTLPIRSSLITKQNPKALPPVPLHRPSTESVQTTASTSSHRTARSTASSVPKKLHKLRPLSQPPPAKHITVQAYRELAQSHIPPVPSEVALKHAERLRQFPLLEHTYPSLSHTRSNETISTNEIPTYVPIRFPSPASSTSNDHTVSGPRPPPQRGYSALRLFRSERRSSQPRTSGQMSFMTEISDFGTVDESLGGSPYDLARNSLPPPPRSFEIPSADFKPTRPEATRAKTYTGMGAQEAADLARLRSRTLAERQQLSFALQQKLSMFDERAGLPGKRQRPKSMTTDTPPVPSLSSSTNLNDETQRRMSGNGAERRTLPQVPNLEVPIQPSKLRKAPPSQSPDPAPPKPTHAAAIEFHKSWEPQRQFWKQRRKSAGEGLSRRSNSRETNETPLQQFQPQSSFTPSTATLAQSFRPSMINVPAPPPHTTSLSPSPRPMSISPAPPPHMYSLSPSPRPMSLSPSPKPISLSPSPGPISMSPSPGPEVMGRYDGGLSFGYEAGYGVGGSAGTRSLLNDGSRRGVDMSMGYGIDLSDVPIILGLKRC